MSMLSFFLRRLVYMIVLLAVLSVVVFVIIQLPPGDYATAYIARMRLQGADLSEEEIVSELCGPRPEMPGGKLGRVTAKGAERADHIPSSLDADAGHCGDPGGTRL